ncbi:helix-turn-helix transcriptional regulator [Aminipila luticellarii]|uniref:YafY family transcriptional regulator n=1 Tax=Aminipila luticellarii TaxID=2507160 RepID=A0A410PTL6_9FIRM|nr:YafY family protein [Aminipila luticellarii]QAT42253.1 YafY family transcriptional regulator [Aminipila luticellarii]
MQINRLFQIIYILLDKKSMTASQLAEKLEVSVRTIYRDVEVLSEAGMPVYMSKGKGGGIFLLPGFVLNKTVLTDREKSEVLASLHAVNSVRPEEKDTVLQKLSSLFGSGNADWIEIDFRSWSHENGENETFETLKNAILSKRTAQFLYASGKGEKTFRKVYPLKLGFKEQSWYLYGYCVERQDYRFFKLRRIKDLEVTEEGFNLAVPPKIFSEDNLFKEEYFNLKLRISSKMAYRVYDEFSQFKQSEDGSFTADILFPKGEWVFSYVASFGEECEVLEPETVRMEIKNKLQSILQYYL